eukprot:763038-Hanusia_phi.AAC.3
MLPPSPSSSSSSLRSLQQQLQSASFAPMFPHRHPNSADELCRGREGGGGGGLRVPRNAQLLEGISELSCDDVIVLLYSLPLPLLSLPCPAL